MLSEPEKQSMIGRLRREKIEQDSQRVAEACEIGKKWAIQSATSDELKAIEDQEDELSDEDEVMDILFKIVRPTLGKDLGELFNVTDTDLSNPAWLVGFVEGALDAYGEVSDEL